MIVSSIEWQIHEMYYFDISTSAISRSTGTIIGDIIAWRNRPLEKHYLMVRMDGTVKVRENPNIINKTVYIALGLRTDGKKEVLRLWLGKTASFVCWMDVLADIKTRGTQDIFVTATDNTDTIKGMLPKAVT